VRTAAQIRTGHWRSATYLKMIRKRADDKCWFFKRSVKMTRSHVLLHCPIMTSSRQQERRRGRESTREASGCCWPNPRWEKRFVRFLELSGVGRTMADGTDEDGARAAKMDEWVVWESWRT